MKEKTAVPASCTPGELADILNPIIHAELASIGALDTAIAREDDPGYTVLFQSAKTGKQANVEQMTSMLRLAGAAPVHSGKPSGLLLKAQTMLAEIIGTTMTLRAMRPVQASIVELYAAAYDKVGEGLYQKGLQKAWRRAIKQLTIITAHIAKRGKHDVEERLALNEPLDRFFAHDEPHVCMRCLFDRPGGKPALERSDPHPYQYICAACHEEVLSDFPADLMDRAADWPLPERLTRVIERALSRPSKLTAEHLVHAKMSGLAPDMPEPPMPRKQAVDVAPSASATQPPASVSIAAKGATADELLYTELLFDYESVRDNW